MPAGCNTHIVPFRLIDTAGAERAAILVHQTGFDETPEEKARGDEASGLSVAIAIEDPPEEGQAILDKWVDEMLPP